MISSDYVNFNRTGKGNRREKNEKFVRKKLLIVCKKGEKKPLLGFWWTQFLKINSFWLKET